MSDGESAQAHSDKGQEAQVCLWDVDTNFLMHCVERRLFSHASHSGMFLLVDNRYRSVQKAQPTCGTSVVATISEAKVPTY